MDLVETLYFCPDARWSGAGDPQKLLELPELYGEKVAIEKRIYTGALDLNVDEKPFVFVFDYAVFTRATPGGAWTLDTARSWNADAAAGMKGPAPVVPDAVIVRMLRRARESITITFTQP